MKARVGTDPSYLRLVRFVGPILCLVMGAGCAYLRSPSLLTLHITRTQVRTPAKIEENRGWGYVTHPFITQFSSSNLLLTYNFAGDGGDKGISQSSLAVWPAYTMDGGRTWALGESNIDSNIRRWVWRGTASDGRRTYVYPFEVTTSQPATCTWFENGHMAEEVTGVTFSTPPLKKDAKLILSPRSVLLRNGELLLAGYVQFADDNYNRTIVLNSTNAGRSFQYLSTVASAKDVPWGWAWPGGFEGASENAFLRLDGGELLCIMRTGNKKTSFWAESQGILQFVQARSRDNGRSWKTRPLYIEGVSPKLVQLSNGVVVLAFGRPGNSLTFSTNGGRSWGREVTLTPADSRTTGYVDIAEVAPGQLLVVYDAYRTSLQRFWLWEPKEVNGVFVSFLDVHRLLGSPRP